MEEAQASKWIMCVVPVGLCNESSADPVQWDFSHPHTVIKGGHPHDIISVASPT